MQLLEQSTQTPSAGIDRSGRMPRSLIVVLSLIAAGDGNIRQVFTKNEPHAQQTVIPSEEAEETKQTASQDIMGKSREKLDYHIAECVHYCNTTDAFLLCNACYVRPLCPERLHAAARELSGDDAREELNAIARILQLNAELAPDAALSIQKHVYEVSLAGRVASATIPIHDPIWWDKEVISATAAKFLELQEGAESGKVPLTVTQSEASVKK